MADINMSNLALAELNTEYVIKNIDTHDKEIEDFLFSLGCYTGENVTVISKIAESFVISVKGARYSIDKELAECIYV